MVGKPIKIDMTTRNLEREKYARVRMEVDFVSSNTLQKSLSGLRYT